ncbi:MULTISPECIES: hypothetical protein [Streptomyces]|uniref:Methyltransferase type 12 n=1 Tax=Streptomyces sviceus (strain ATCC 29083 / DSM 924 / JCM 4929 / NBRC 13980 / NCIMB 11184 / NRRL 5439 / UC 5370) TaxID=463191 RepID=B5HU88_STRX2|nr:MULTISPECIES: hypothetical protein [Streptomyces]EDY56393.1 methyltransferase type 12 [Streptomyces sviceus ATCC 29083]
MRGPGGTGRRRAGALPEIPGVRGPYDVVLLSAVWMHLRPEERPVAMRRPATLRRGEPPLDRRMFDIPPEEVAGHGGVQAGLRLLRTVAEGADRLGRDAVHWHAVALQLG